MILDSSVNDPIIAKYFWGLVIKSGLSDEDARVLLGRTIDMDDIRRLRCGLVLPDSKMVRAMAINAILLYTKVRGIYYHNPSLAYNWFNSRSSYFGDKSPIQIIDEDGGYQAICSMLDGFTNL